MKFLHTMVRITDIEQSLTFYSHILGLKEVRRYDNEKGKFTLIFLAAPDQLKAAKQTQSPLLELTYNWDLEIYKGGRNFGHLAFQVPHIYKICQRLLDHNIIINRPPRDGRMAFIKSPDGISIELLQEGEALPLEEPWVNMKNEGSW
ncbi:lactoylglutathione lyase [Candidatus Marinamargulisbacteria bacterium SCGC AG-333-B06]|nr:lactoylglutathione lyase [Candidatus Marinamargulisbacteria bacterium SCGC AG-333-B06]